MNGKHMVKGTQDSKDGGGVVVVTMEDRCRGALTER